MSAWRLHSLLISPGSLAALTRVYTRFITRLYYGSDKDLISSKLLVPLQGFYTHTDKQLLQLRLPKPGSGNKIDGVNDRTSSFARLINTYFETVVDVAREIFPGQLWSKTCKFSYLKSIYDSFIGPCLSIDTRIATFLLTLINKYTLRHLDMPRTTH